MLKKIEKIFYSLVFSAAILFSIYGIYKFISDFSDDKIHIVELIGNLVIAIFVLIMFSYLLYNMDSIFYPKSNDTE